jgi:hypothetical protein
MPSRISATIPDTHSIFEQRRPYPVITASNLIILGRCFEALICPGAYAENSRYRDFPGVGPLASVFRRWDPRGGSDRNDNKRCQLETSRAALEVARGLVNRRDESTASV